MSIKNSKPICKANLVYLCLTILFLTQGAFAGDLEKELHDLATTVVDNTPGSNAHVALSIAITNQQTHRSDSLATFIETQLELAIRRKLLDSRAFLEAVADHTISINGEFQLTDTRIGLWVNISHENRKTDWHNHYRHHIKAEYSEHSSKKHVSVLNVKTNLLPKKTNDKISNSLRQRLNEREIYHLSLARTGILSQTCESVLCLSKLGRKLQVDFILQPKLDRLSDFRFVLTADLIDVHKESLLARVSVNHNGSLLFLEGSIDDLANQVFLQEPLLRAASEDLATNTGYLSLTSEPRGADIFINSERLPHQTNILLADIAAGKHTISIRFGIRERTVDIELQAGEIKQIHAVLEPFAVRSFSLVRDANEPLLPGFEMTYSLSIDPASVTAQTLFLRKEGERLEGSLRVNDKTVFLKPNSRLLAGQVYEITATREIRSIHGDMPDHPYKRHYRAARAQ